MRPAATFHGTPAPPEAPAPERHHSLPLNPYAAAATAYPPPDAAPQFTDSFNGNRPVSPPGLASAHEGLRRRSTVVTRPAALAERAVELGVYATEPRHGSTIDPDRPSTREADQAAQRAGFRSLVDFKQFLIETLPPGAEFMAGATSTIAGLVEGWAARSLNITSAVAAGLKSGAEFIDAIEKGDYPKAALQGLNLIGLGLNIDGAVRNLPALTAAGGLVGTGAGFVNSVVEQRRAARQRSPHLDVERRGSGQGAGTADPSGSQRRQSPPRWR